jgi:hypothetical protein
MDFSYIGLATLMLFTADFKLGRQWHPACCPFLSPFHNIVL